MKFERRTVSAPFKINQHKSTERVIYRDSEHLPRRFADKPQAARDAGASLEVQIDRSPGTGDVVFTAIEITGGDAGPRRTSAIPIYLPREFAEQIARFILGRAA